MLLKSFHKAGSALQQRLNICRAGVGQAQKFTACSGEPIASCVDELCQGSCDSNCSSLRTHCRAQDTSPLAKHEASQFKSSEAFHNLMHLQDHTKGAGKQLRHQLSTLALRSGMNSSQASQLLLALLLLGLSCLVGPKRAWVSQGHCSDLPQCAFQSGPSMPLP